MAKVNPKMDAIFRAKLNCKIGRDTLDGIGRDPPHGVSRLEFSVFSLLYAVEELASAIDEIKLGVQNDR